MTEKLAQLMTDFICNTVHGYESGLYKGISSHQDNFAKFGDHAFTIYLINFNVHYFNTAYSSLIKNDDPGLTEKFDEMQEVLNHSYICLLNILFRLTTEILTSYTRTKLNTSSYKSYMDNIESILEERRVALMIELPKCLSHECTGLDIKTCNPDEPLFYMGTKPSMN